MHFLCIHCLLACIGKVREKWEVTFLAQRFVHPSYNRALHLSHTLHVQGIPDFFNFFSMFACFQVHLVGVRGVASEDDWGLNYKNNPTYLEGRVGLLIKRLLI